MTAEILFTSQAKVEPSKNETEQVELRKQMKELALQRRREVEEQQKTQEVVRKHVPETPKGEESWDDDDEEDTPALLLKPIFVKPDERQEAITPEINKKEQKTKERQREAHELLIEHVRKEYQASVANDDDVTANRFDPATVDDTDDVNIEEEVQAWRLRELLRIKRDREEREHWEREKMELERIRNMTEEERRQLDEEKMKEWMEQPKSQMRFMQKYYHKGAFFMDDTGSLYGRDYAQPTGEDASANRELLPEVKQVRDFGKKGRTKWTHLVGEDTTAFDYGWGQRKNEMNYKLVSKMGGMQGYLDNPSKRRKHN